MKNKLLILLLVLCAHLAAETLHLSIRYLGMPVVRVTMTDQDSTLLVTAKATTVATIAAKMNNRYEVHYRGSYLGESYKKRIKQKGYQEDREIRYMRDAGTAKRTSRISPSRNRIYPIQSDCRDFFSALYFLRTAKQDAGSLCLDAVGMMWDVTYKVVKHETIQTALGKVPARKMKMNFSKREDRDTERSDMLTNNLVSDRTLYFWFSDDDRNIPVKAVFKMSPFSVVWRLDSYEKTSDL